MGAKSCYGRFWLGLLVLLLGVLVNLLYINSFFLRNVGLALLLGGMLLIRASNVRDLLDTRATNDPQATPREGKRISLAAWVVSGASMAGLIVFYSLMLRADRAGGHDVWPVYAFGICGFVATLALGYLFSKFFSGRF